MKHNTHIFISSKAIEFCYDSLKNLHDSSGNEATNSVRNKLRKRGRVLQRLLEFHKTRVIEASWAPDSILKDMQQFHTFKLYNEDCFEDASDYNDQNFCRNGKNYFRAKGSGGLAFKIDHLAKIIHDIQKLRHYNDNYSMEHIMYLFLLLSHYVVDAHVPMHCDLRDDAASPGRPQDGVYYEEKDWHTKLENKWEKATNYIAKRDKMYSMDDLDKNISKSDLVDHIEISVADIKTYVYDRKNIMNHAIDICVNSYERALELIPPGTDELDNERLPEVTRSIYTDAIGNLISIWISLWEEEKIYV